MSFVKITDLEEITADELTIDDYVLVSHLELDRKRDQIVKTSKKMRVSELLLAIHRTLENGPISTR